MKPKQFICFLLLLVSLVARAQYYEFTQESEKFGQEVDSLFQSFRNEGLVLMGSEFKTMWGDGTLNDDQKAIVIDIAVKLHQKHFKLIPHQANFFSGLVKAHHSAGLDYENLLAYLQMTQKVVDVYGHKQIHLYLITMRNFFAKNALYYSNYNQLLFDSGTITFDFIPPTIEESIVLDYEEEEEIKDIEEEDLVTEEDLVSLEEADDSWGSDGDDGGFSSGWGDDGESWGSDWSSGFSEEKSEKEEESPEEVYFEFYTEPVFTPPEVAQPIVEGPLIKFENSNLTISTPYDSVLIIETLGAFMVVDNLFVGEGGKMDWMNSGLSPDSVYCELSAYNFKVNIPALSADNVSVSYFGKLDKPAKGTIRFASVKRLPDELSGYPKFQSYFNDIVYTNVWDDKLRMVGGFTLTGDRISSSSVSGGLSTMVGSYKGLKGFEAKSKEFVFDDSLITADRSSISIYHGGDSLYHPALIFHYYPDTSLLRVFKDHSGFKHSPFYSTYFEMDISAEIIHWNLESDSMEISMLNARNQIPVKFESHEYFDEQRFNRLSYLYDFNPLLLAIGYSHRINSLEFNLYDLASEMKQNPNTVKSAMAFLSQNGFIELNPNNGAMRIKRKAIHYYLSKRKKRDFDNLLIISKTPHYTNATFNLLKQEMTIRGVEKFYISRELDVFIEPDSGVITLLKNRDFLFDGLVNAGNFEYIGKGHRFDYDSFLVVMPTVDSVKFNIPTKNRDRNDEVVKQSLDNQLQETGGTLYINDPHNKSARKDFPQYPIFDASIGAIVYFDKPEILNGAYNKSLYFTVPPFKIDSVSSSDPNAIGFEGTFHSDIFPEFEQKLVVMEDKSFGFVYNLPPEGFPLYSGMAQIYSDLKLDNQGLRANGQLDYQSSTLNSEEFTFYLDSVTAIGSEAVIRDSLIAGASYPEGHVANFKMTWFPRRDSMYVTNLGDPIQFYDETASLDGAAIISSRGLYGSGKLLTRGAEANSNNMTLAQAQISARHAKFEIKSDNPDKPALKGDDIKLDFNLETNLADIGPEVQGVAALDFPYAQVKTSIPQATWDLQNQMVHMLKPEEVDINDSYFYTTREDLDSLAFNATTVVYDINQLTLNVYGIPFIKVADAKITPENNTVLFLENAQLSELHNATLLIDTLNGYHNLIDGDITIVSRNRFEGSATYRYVNAVEDTFDIKMGAFYLQTEKIKKGMRKQEVQYTVSSGNVAAEDNVIVSPGMIFKGTMTMFANKQALELDGGVKLDLKNIANYDTWIKYKNTADVQEIIIPFDKSVTEEGLPLTAGLHFDSDNNLYGTFITDKRSPDDEDFFVPSGLLKHDVVNNDYSIGEFYKTTGESFQGRIYVYNENTSDIRFEGPLNFISDPSVSMDASGNGKGNLETSDFSFDTFLTFNFNMPSEALDIMAADIQDVVERIASEEAEPDKTALLYKVSEIIGDKAAKEYENRSLATYTPLVSMSTRLVRSLVLSNVDFKWSSDHKAWYSIGKIGLSNVKREDINASLQGFVEIQKSFEGESVNMFFQITPNTWYYFSFEGNRLLLFSSNKQFNELIADKTNVNKAKIGEYVFVEGDIEETEDFIQRFSNTYLDSEVPFEFVAPAEAPEDFDTFEVIDDDEIQEDDGFEETPEFEEEEEDFSPFGVEDSEEEEEDDGF